MKILFLDHQGVIHLEKAIWSDRKPVLLDFDQEAVNILNEIIREVDCEIVISSDWKTWVDLPEMQSFYTRQGIIKPPIDYTPATKANSSDNIAYLRAREIREWLDSKEDISSWIAVDDLDMREYLSNFVWIEDIERGLKVRSVKDSILNYLL